jgi:glycosyltransferase involved in cell wall biosynthesis
MNSRSSSAISTIRLLAVMEPKTVTGAAKTMLDFCKATRDLGSGFLGSTAIETSIATFERGRHCDPNRGNRGEGSANNVDQSPNGFVAAARKIGLEVDIIPERAPFDLSVIPALRKIVNQRAPDIILTQHVKSHFVVRLSKLWREYSWIAFHHGYTKTLPRERIYNRMDRLSLPKADRVITVCEAFARELTSVAGVPRERIHVQHNSIRPEKVGTSEEAEMVRKRLGIAKDESLVLSVGRLSREKAHIDLLSAFNRLRENNPATKSTIVIVGEGPERASLAAAAASLRLTESVIFVGEVSNVQPYYAAADVVVLPSHSEGSPYVLLEAMAAKVPIVATAVGGVPEMVEDEQSALLVPARDPRAMAAAIARVLTDPELARKLTANGSALVGTRYSPQSYVRSLLEIYREVISTSTKRNSQVR